MPIQLHNFDIAFKNIYKMAECLMSEMSLGSHLFGRYADLSLLDLSLNSMCSNLNTKLAKNYLTNLLGTQSLFALRFAHFRGCCLFMSSFFHNYCCMIIHLLL